MVISYIAFNDLPISQHTVAPLMAQNRAALISTEDILPIKINI